MFSPGDETCEEVFVPGGDATLDAQAVLSGSSAQQVAGHVFDGGEVGRRVVLSDAALVVAEDHVHDPVEAVLDAPMASNSDAQGIGIGGGGGNVKAPLTLDLGARMGADLAHGSTMTMLCRPGQSWASLSQAMSSLAVVIRLSMRPWLFSTVWCRLMIVSARACRP